MNTLHLYIFPHFNPITNFPLGVRQQGIDEDALADAVSLSHGRRSENAWLEN